MLGPLFEVAMLKNCTPLWREAHFEVKMYKTRQLRTTFSSQNVKKLTVSEHFLKFRSRKIAHAAVGRSTCSSENVQNTSASDHFLKFRCSKIVRRCGEKHIFKSKCTKYLCFAALFEVQMSKNSSVSQLVS